MVLCRARSRTAIDHRAIDNRPRFAMMSPCKLQAESREQTDRTYSCVGGGGCDAVRAGRADTHKSSKSEKSDDDLAANPGRDASGRSYRTNAS